MMNGTHRWLVALAVCVFSGAVSAQADLIDVLRQGGYHLFFRHAITDGEDPRKVNPPNETLANCASQRLLNDAGRAQARQIGLTITQLGIPVGDVYASPFCRCEETARLAFARGVTVDWLLAQRGRGMPRLNQVLRAIPSTGGFTPTPTGKNNVYVGHAITFSEGLVGPEFGRHVLREGEALVIAPGEPPRVLGKIRFY
jgi:hypothetical protein